MDTSLFTHYWWLIFPVGFMVLGLVRTILRDGYERKKLEVMKAYLDAGKTPPVSLNRDC